MILRRPEIGSTLSSADGGAAGGEEAVDGTDAGVGALPCGTVSSGYRIRDGDGDGNGDGDGKGDDNGDGSAADLS